VIEKITNESPLRFVVGPDDTAYLVGTPSGSGFVLPAGKQDLPLPSVSSCEEVRRWVLSQGGADAGATYLQVVIQGRHSSPVLVQGVRALVVSREPAMHDTLVACPTEGQQPVIGLGFNLDREPVLARVLFENGKFGPPYFGGDNISVGNGELVTLAITARTQECFCGWKIEIDATVDGERRTFVLDQNGHPFYTNSLPEKAPHQLLWNASLKLEGHPWAKCPGTPGFCPYRP